jgi:hypothetical protein
MTYMLAVWRCWSPLKRLSVEMGQGGQAGLVKWITAGVKRGLLASSPSSPYFTLSIRSRRSDDSLIAEGWLRDRQCHTTINSRASVSIDTGASLAVARPDITAGPLDRKPSWPYIFHMA